jgi:soluble lytic murein transglycosylase
MLRTSGKELTLSGKNSHPLIRRAISALLLFFLLLFIFFPKQTATALREEKGVKRGFSVFSRDSALFERLMNKCRGECCEKIKELSEKGEADSLLIYILAYVESSFKQYAVSNKGAIGITQIKPDVGKDIAYELKIPFSEELLFDCEYNLKMGVYYFKKMLDTFNDLELAFVAYNMGPTFVLNKLKSGEFISRKYLSRIEKFLEEVRSYEE